MSRIYSNSYFHYTKDFDLLTSILKHGFKGYYCREEFKVGRNVKNIYIPMVSFCDLPLAHISQITYGDWGVGMSSVWGNANELTPVCYFPNNIRSTLTHYISILVNDFFKKALTSNKSINRCAPLLAYAKPRRKYTSTKHRSDNYIERECRKAYVDCSIDQDFHRRPHPTMLLKFSVDDIDFIIVPSETERKQLIDTIINFNMVGGSPLTSPTQRLILISKVITKQEILKNY